VVRGVWAKALSAAYLLCPGQDGDRGTGSGISPRKAPEKAAKPMRLEEYLDKASVGLERSDVKEATVGFTQRGVEVWRKAFEPVMNGFGIDA